MGGRALGWSHFSLVVILWFLYVWLLEGLLGATLFILNLGVRRLDLMASYHLATGCRSALFILQGAATLPELMSAQHPSKITSAAAAGPAGIHQ